MLQKQKLYESRQYNKVFINHDQPLVVRQMANNFRTVLGALQQHGLVVRGSRVLRMDQARGNTRQDRSGSDDRRDESFTESAHTNSNRASGNRNSYADAAGGRGTDSHRGSQGQPGRWRGQNQSGPYTNVKIGVTAITATVNLIIS